MEFKKVILSAAVIAMSPVSFAGIDKAGTFYIGGGAGQSTAKEVSDPRFSVSDGQYIVDYLVDNNASNPATVTSVGSDSDDDDGAAKFFIGYNINQYFAVEAAYLSLGEFSESVSAKGVETVNGVETFNEVETFNGSIKAKADTDDSYSLSLLASYPLLDKFSVFARVGVYYYDIDTKVSLISDLGLSESMSKSESGTDMVYGLGAAYDISANFSARIEWERYNDMEVDDFGTGLDLKSDLDLYSASVIYTFD